MITADFIIILFLAIIFGAVCGFLFLSSISNFFFYEVYKEYQNATSQNQVKILKQKISDAEKELQKYLIDHPELEIEER